MQELRGIVSGPVVVDEDMLISGIVKGDVSVAAGCTIEMSGIVNGDIILAPGAIATVTGMIDGTIVRR